MRPRGCAPQVSHWGRVEIEEAYEVAHGGAVVTGAFSRWNLTADAAYAAENHRSASPAITALVAALPAAAQHVRLRDELGAVLNLEVTRRDAALAAAAFKPRFPLLGGWRARFVLSYALPLAACVAVGRERGVRRALLTFAPPLTQARAGACPAARGCSFLRLRAALRTHQARAARSRELSFSKLGLARGQVCRQMDTGRHKI